ncbi:MAG: PAS domain S-box protein [Anaerolineales bacterium]
MNLRTRLSIAFLSLCLISMAAIAAVMFRMGRNQIIDDTFNRLTVTNQLMLQDYERWLGDGVRTLEATAQRPLVVQLARSLTTGDGKDNWADRAALVQTHLRPRLDEATFSKLYFIDPLSAQVVASTDSEQEGMGVKDQVSNGDGLERTTLDTTGHAPGSNRALTVISTPVTDHEGNVIGVLAGELDLDELEVIFANPDPLRISEESYLVSVTGGALNPLKFNPDAVSSGGVSSPGIEMCLAGQDHQGGYPDYRGVAVLGVYNWLPEYKSCLVTEIDESEVLAPISSYRSAVISLGLLMALLAAAAGFFYSGMLAEPVKAMRDAAERFRRGDLNARMMVPKTDEYAELAIAYNRMADELQRDLEELGTRYRTLFNSVPVGLYQSTLAGEMSEANRMLADILGYRDIEELKSVPTPVRHVNPEDEQRWLDELRVHGIVQEYEVQVLRKDESPIWIRHDAQLVTGEDGEEILEGVVFDMTERRQVERQLSASDARFRSVVQNSLDITIILDAEGNCKFVSPAIEQVLGHPPETLIGSNVLELVNPEDVADVELLFEELLAEPGSVRRAQLRFLHSDGSWRELEMIWTNHLDNSDIDGVVVNSRDVTARVAAEQLITKYGDELKHSNQELEQFAYVASHDLQEPLRMVSSYVQLLADRYRDRLDGDALEFIDYAVDGAQRMQKLINDLLDFSRVGTRGKELVPTDSGLIIADALNNLETRIDDCSAKVSVEGEMPVVMGDKGQLTRVIQNLIGNALKFKTDEIPVVRLWVEPRGTHCQFAIQDNGIGIDPRFADRLFVIFQRLHNRTEYEGNGIGLAISKKIIERHGGKIWFDSQPGEGTTFFFTLPVVAEREELFYASNAN